MYLPKKSVKREQRQINQGNYPQPMPKLNKETMQRQSLGVEGTIILHNKGSRIIPSSSSSLIQLVLVLLQYSADRILSLPPHTPLSLPFLFLFFLSFCQKIEEQIDHNKKGKKKKEGTIIDNALDPQQTKADIISTSIYIER